MLEARNAVVMMVQLCMTQEMQNIENGGIFTGEKFAKLIIIKMEDAHIMDQRMVIKR